MAAAHSTLKARSGRNPPRKTGPRPKSATRSKTPVKRRKTQPAQAAKGPATPTKRGSTVAGRGARIHVEERLRDMIRAEMFNLGKAESVLRCLWLSMDSMSTDPGLVTSRMSWK